MLSLVHVLSVVLFVPPSLRVKTMLWIFNFPGSFNQFSHDQCHMFFLFRSSFVWSSFNLLLIIRIKINNMEHQIVNSMLVPLLIFLIFYSIFSAIMNCFWKCCMTDSNPLLLLFEDKCIYLDYFDVMLATEFLRIYLSYRYSSFTFSNLFHKI